jgi:hypothetical protein
MNEQSAGVDSLLKILAELPTATPTIEELVEASGIARSAFDDACAEADMAGLVSSWEDHPDGAVIMLSPLAADRMGLRLVEADGGLECIAFRWVPKNEPESKSDRLCRPLHKQIQATTIDGEAGFDYLDTVEDDRAVDPAERIERAENVEEAIHAPRPANPKGRAVPRESIASTWRVQPIGLRPQCNGPVEPEGQPCRGCGGRSIGIGEVCVICLRSGLDPFLEPAKPIVTGTARKGSRSPARRSGRPKAPRGGKRKKTARASA